MFAPQTPNSSLSASEPHLSANSYSVGDMAEHTIGLPNFFEHPLKESVALSLALSHAG